MGKVITLRYSRFIPAGSSSAVRRRRSGTGPAAGLAVAPDRGLTVAVCGGSHGVRPPTGPRRGIGLTKDDTPWPPAIVVHGHDHALAALSARLPVTLLSGRGAGVYGGVGWWRALVSAARAASPGAVAPDILDCADAPGAAMAALRGGQRVLVLDPDSPAFAAVRGAAATLGARVLPARPPALALAALGLAASDLAAFDLATSGAARGLARWLAGATRDRP